MTQPPLSYQIKMLEEELGVKLFVRGAKNTTLTEAGKALYIRAGSLLTMADITKREVIKANEVATIHIGLAPSTVSMMAKQFNALFLDDGQRFLRGHRRLVGEELAVR